MTRPMKQSDPGRPRTAAEVVRELEALADPLTAKRALTYFKTPPVHHGDPDRFLGVRAADLHRIAKASIDLSDEEVIRFLRRAVHECRTVALLTWGRIMMAKRTDEDRKESIFRRYCENIDRVDNWDLVDCSAAEIVGTYLTDKPRRMLQRWSRSSSLWERRISIVATRFWIRRGEFNDTLRLACKLQRDPEDLVQKAVGWMLREVGKKDKSALIGHLEEHADRMARTTLRYAIERLTARERQDYLERRTSR